MPRQPGRPQRHEPGPLTVRNIHPTDVYLLHEARRVLNLARLVIREEIHTGRLRVGVVGKRYYILGQWILDWLEALPAPTRCQLAADPSLSPALRRARDAAARLTAEELAAFRAWLADRPAAADTM